MATLSSVEIAIRKAFVSFSLESPMMLSLVSREKIHDLIMRTNHNIMKIGLKLCSFNKSLQELVDLPFLETFENEHLWKV